MRQPVSSYLRHPTTRALTEGGAVPLRALAPLRRNRGLLARVGAVLVLAVLVEQLLTVPLMVGCAALAGLAGLWAARRETPHHPARGRGANFVFSVAAGLVSVGLAVAVWMTIGLLLPAAVTVVVGLVLIRGLRQWWTRQRRPGARGYRSHLNADGGAKVGFDDRRAALEAARTFEARHPGETMNAYHCATCPKWHIGHAK